MITIRIKCHLSLCLSTSFTWFNYSLFSVFTWVNPTETSNSNIDATGPRTDTRHKDGVTLSYPFDVSEVTDNFTSMRKILIGEGKTKTDFE